jgi:hypothetical protein
MDVLKTISATVCPSAPIETPLKMVPSANAMIAGDKEDVPSGKRDGSTV